MVKAIFENDENTFETACNILIQDGYELESCNCGITGSEYEGYVKNYQAILIKKD